jgi:hypothetical protein
LDLAGESGELVLDNLTLRSSLVPRAISLASYSETKEFQTKQLQTVGDDCGVPDLSRA